MGERLPWAFILSASLMLVFVLASQMYVWVNLWPLSATWYEALLWSVPQALIWGLLVYGISAFSRVFPIDRGRPAIRVPVHVVASAAVAACGLGILDLSDRVLHWTALMGAPARLVSRFEITVVHLHIGIAIYWIVIAVDHARRYYLRVLERDVRASRLEAQLARAELEALRLQLDPHFLFNTLNSIGVLMRRDVARAEEMLHRLGDLLQATLREAERHEVPFRVELDYLRSYLEIEAIRFQDRLSVRVDADPETLDCGVPFLITQPLVENAVRHGVARRAGPGRIGVEARRRDGAVEIVVRDDGPGLPDAGWVEGVGLANTRARLRSLYGDDQELRLESPSGGGTVVTVRVPCHPCVVDDASAPGGGEL